MKVEEIRFYRATGEHGYLSNLYRCHIVVNDVGFRSAEDAYQWAKPIDRAVADWLISAPTPALCALAAHALLPWQVRRDWQDVKLDRMRQVLRAKFEQHIDLAVKLHETGGALLIEESSTDSFWGTGRKGTGQNMLGVLLMELRAAIQAAREAPDA